MYHSMIKFDAIAQVVKLVDTRDLKSLEGNFVPMTDDEIKSIDMVENHQDQIL